MVKSAAVRRYAWKEFDGFDLNDEIVEWSPDRYVLRRNGELIIVSDEEITVRL